MKFENVDVISPALFPTEQWNEAEVLGAMTWLWFVSENCKNLSVSDLSLQVLPTLKSRQFAVLSQNSQPLGYISWANLDANQEAEYVYSERWIYTHPNWNSGDRMWLIHWFAPHGQSKLLKRIVENYLFPEQCFRALYHRGDNHGLKVMNFHGKLVEKTVVSAWIKQHPILAKTH